ncbi:hypothetical protein PVAND_000198 [Polypedilum vanderplanki]|uniref:Odorant receptor n=1 Tax=Polypedilum vanderplanki TaxID=319348 RepID=A0A9J6BJ99_POLVA|nr:hypothetical protein PVAND_000198 [Polypedilum vanderplanki]
MKIKEIFKQNNFMRNESFYRIQKLSWKLLGFFIGNNEVSKFKFFLLIFNCMEVLVYGIFQLYYSYEHRENLKLVLDGLTPWLTEIPCVLRILILVWYRKDVKKVLDYLKDIFEKTTDNDERMINARANQLSSILMGVTGFFIISTDFCYILYPIFSNIYQFINGQNIAYEFPYKASFPFNYKQFPIYPIIFLFSIHTGNITACSLISGDGIILGSCFHLAAQFEIISFKIQKLLFNENDDYEPFTNKQNIKIYHYLIEIINIHNEAIEKCRILSKVLWKNILMQFVSASFIMSVSALMLLQSNDVSMLIYVFYITSYFIMLFNYALCGNTLINASTKIQQTIYEFPWYQCDVKVRKMLLMMIIRSQRPVNLKVPFFEVNLQTFSTILRVFSSFFTLAKTFM